MVGERDRQRDWDLSATVEFIKFDKFGNDRLDPFVQNKNVFLLVKQPSLYTFAKLKF